MNRSEVNRIIREMEEAVRRQGLKLPPFAFFSPEEWKTKDHSWDEARLAGLGWDITDHGLGDFRRNGLALFTLRNGSKGIPGYEKPYAEKLIYLYAGAHTAMHYHAKKMEDIINRGESDILIRLYNCGENGSLSDGAVTVRKDGRCLTVPAGEDVRVGPGESLTLTPYLYHCFMVPEDGGPALLGEVSMCNDDQGDNFFYGEVRRFPAIEEDEEPYRLLCTEYPPAP